MMFGMGAGEAYIVFGDDEPFDISGWTSPDFLLSMCFSAAATTDIVKISISVTAINFNKFIR